MCIWDRRTDTDRQTDSLHRLGLKNEKIQIYVPTHEILMIITFSIPNAYPSLHKCPGSQELSWSHTQSMHVQDDSDQHSDLWLA